MRSGQKEPILMNAFLQLARSIAEATTCRRAAVGCVLTNLDFSQVVGSGYNGVPSGYPNDGCEGTDQPGSCAHTCAHAELNAVIKAPPGPKVAFVSCAPCRGCAIALVNAGVVAVVFEAGHRPIEEGLDLLDHCLVPYGSVDEVWAAMLMGDDVEEDFSTEAGWNAAKARRSKFS